MTRGVLAIDVGGVLVELRDYKSLRSPLQARYEDAIAKTSVLGLPIREAFQRGKIKSQEFAALVQSHDHMLSEKEIVLCEQKWLGDMNEALATEIGLIPDIHIVVFSNTHEIHWKLVEPQLRSKFRRFTSLLSFNTGHMKPEREAFLELLSMADGANNLLFVDDALANIEAAKNLGICTLHYNQRSISIQAIRAFAESW